MTGPRKGFLQAFCVKNPVVVAGCRLQPIHDQFMIVGNPRPGLPLLGKHPGSIVDNVEWCG